MSKSAPSRGVIENRERAAATVPTQKWWVGVILWVAVAVLVGFIYRLLAPVTNAPVTSRWEILRYVGTLVVNVIAMYGICYFAARQTLARRGLKEIWKSESNRNAMNRFGLPLLLSVGGLGVLVASQSVTESLFAGLLALSTIFSVYRALTTAYTSHYFDYVISPLESREMENDKDIKGKKRLALERMLITLGFYYPRQRLVFPLFQTLLVVFGIQAIVTFGWLGLGGTQESLTSSYWLGVAAPAFPVASVILWGLWHLKGGTGKIFRLSEGRPMKSFGWQHPELLTTGK